jgi:hypothetical protein
MLSAAHGAANDLPRRAGLGARGWPLGLVFAPVTSAAACRALASAKTRGTRNVGDSVFGAPSAIALRASTSAVASRASVHVLKFVALLAHVK